MGNARQDQQEKDDGMTDKSDTPLIVTRGDGIPVQDQAMGVELFKAQCRISYLERRVAALEAGLSVAAMTTRDGLLKAAEICEKRMGYSPGTQATRDTDARVIRALAAQEPEGWVAVDDPCPQLASSYNAFWWKAGLLYCYRHDGQWFRLAATFPKLPPITAPGSGGQTPARSDSQESPAAGHCPDAVPSWNAPTDGLIHEPNSSKVDTPAVTWPKRLKLPPYPLVVQQVIGTPTETSTHTFVSGMYT